MAGLRFAFLITSSSRYVNLIIGLGVTMALSRLLTPADIGTVLVGTNVALLLACVRDFCSPVYLVQKPSLEEHDVSALALAQIGLGLLLGLALVIIAPLMAGYFQYPDLSRFLYFVAIALQLDALALPGQALLQRDLRFGALATIILSQTIAHAVIAITLAFFGYGILSLAYAWIGGSLITAVTTFILVPPRWLLKPSFSGMSDAFAFGRYHGASSSLARAHEAITAATVGKSLSLSDAGYFGRATTLSQLNERLFSDVVISLALPSFSEHLRKTGDTLTRLYLKWLEIIAAVHWPGLILLIILADPIVVVLYGTQWQAVVPIVQIIAMASFFKVPIMLAWPALVAVGGIRDRLFSNMITLPLTTFVFVIGAQFGLKAAALSYLVFTPINAIVEIHFVRRRIPLPWRSLAGALRKPAAVTITTATGPLAVLATYGEITPTVGLGVIIGLIGLCGWVAGVYGVKHELAGEITHAVRQLRQVVRSRAGTPPARIGDDPATRHIAT